MLGAGSSDGIRQHGSLRLSPMLLPQFHSHRFQSPACRTGFLQQMAEMEQSFHVKLPFSSATSDLGAANEALGLSRAASALEKGSHVPTKSLRAAPRAGRAEFGPQGEAQPSAGMAVVIRGHSQHIQGTSCAAQSRLVRLTLDRDFYPLSLPLDVQALEQTQCLLPKLWNRQSSPCSSQPAGSFPSLSHLPFQAAPQH